MKKVVAVDRCLSLRLPSVLNAMYGHHGFEFVSVKDIGGGPDTFWADAFKRFGGEIVLSGDHHIATRPHEAIAFIDNGFKSFFPAAVWHKLAIQQKNAYITHVWGLIMDRLDKIPIGSCWRMEIDYRAEQLTLGREPKLQRLEIPQAVLDRHRIKKASGEAK